jgi:hypothetical protein
MKTKNPWDRPRDPRDHKRALLVPGTTVFALRRCDIGQAVPIAGSFIGTPNDYLGMTVDVSVVSENRGNSGAHPR